MCWVFFDLERCFIWKFSISGNVQLKGKTKLHSKENRFEHCQRRFWYHCPKSNFNFCRRCSSTVPTQRVYSNISIPSVCRPNMVELAPHRSIMDRHFGSWCVNTITNFAVSDLLLYVSYFFVLIIGI